jgi:hypothetical protein
MFYAEPYEGGGEENDENYTRWFLLPHIAQFLNSVNSPWKTVIMT